MGESIMASATESMPSAITIATIMATATTRPMVPRRATVTNGIMSQRRDMELPMSTLRKKAMAAKKAMVTKKTTESLLIMATREATDMILNTALLTTAATPVIMLLTTVITLMALTANTALLTI